MNAKDSFDTYPLMYDADREKLHHFLEQCSVFGIEAVPPALCLEIYSIVLPLISKYRHEKYYRLGANLSAIIMDLVKRLKLSGFAESFRIAEDAIAVVEHHLEILRFPRDVEELHKNLGLLVAIYESYPGRRPGSRDNYYQSLLNLGKHQKRYAQLLSNAAAPDLVKIRQLHVQAIECSKLYFKQYQNNEALKALTETAWQSANTLVSLKCYDLAFSILNEMVVLLQQTEVFGKHWFIAKIYSGLADAFEATKNAPQQFANLRLAYHSYSLTNDTRHLERIALLLIKATEDKVRLCFAQPPTDEQREQGWEAAKNALILAMQYRDETKIESLLEELGQFLNVPQLVTLVRKEMNLIDNRLPLKPFVASLHKKAQPSEYKARYSREKDGKRERDYQDRDHDERKRSGHNNP